METIVTVDGNYNVVSIKWLHKDGSFEKVTIDKEKEDEKKEES